MQIYSQTSANTKTRCWCGTWHTEHQPRCIHVWSVLFILRFPVLFFIHFLLLLGHSTFSCPYCFRKVVTSPVPKACEAASLARSQQAATHAGSAWPRRAWAFFGQSEQTGLCPFWNADIRCANADTSLLSESKRTQMCNSGCLIQQSAIYGL